MAWSDLESAKGSAGATLARSDAEFWAFAVMDAARRDGGVTPPQVEAAMEQAIKDKSSAIIEISFDSKWRKMAKSRSGNYGFEDNSLGWIKIESGKLTFTDRTNKPLMNDKAEATLTGQQIKDLTKTLVATFTLIELTTYNKSKPYIFAAGDMKPVEADLVIKLIQKHVMGKAAAQVRR